MYKLEAFPFISTDRLVLDQPRLTDSLRLFEIISDKNTADSLNMETIVHLDASTQILKDWRSGFRKRKSLRWAIREKNSEELIGTVGFRNFSNTEGELGFVLNPEARQKGYMTEILAEVIRFGFEKLALTKISAYVLNENLPSQRLLKKLGFRQKKDDLSGDLLLHFYLIK